MGVGMVAVHLGRGLRPGAGHADRAARAGLGARRGAAHQGHRPTQLTGAAQRVLLHGNHPRSDMATRVGLAAAPIAPGSGWCSSSGSLSAFGPLSIDMYLPAFPSLSEDLHAGPSAVQLTLTACLIGLAVGQLVAGPLSTRSAAPAAAGRARRLHRVVRRVCRGAVGLRAGRPAAAAGLAGGARAGDRRCRRAGPVRRRCHGPVPVHADAGQRAGADRGPGDRRPIAAVDVLARAFSSCSPGSAWLCCSPVCAWFDESLPPERRQAGQSRGHAAVVRATAAGPRVRRLRVGGRPGVRGHVRLHLRVLVRAAGHLRPVPAAVRLGVRHERAGHRGRRPGEPVAGEPVRAAPAAGDRPGRRHRWAGALLVVAVRRVGGCRRSCPDCSLVVASIGIVLPNTRALATADYPDLAGTASRCSVCSQFAIGGAGRAADRGRRHRDRAADGRGDRGAHRPGTCGIRPDDEAATG